MKRVLKYTVLTFLFLVALTAAIIGYREAKDYYDDWYIDATLPRSTVFASTDQPDQVCLTWSDDPRITQTVQWRTNTSVNDGSVEWKCAGSAEVSSMDAARVAVEDKMLKNDPVIHRFAAVLKGLAPATTYEYRVGSKTNNKWSEWLSFTTAPDERT